MGDGSRLDQLRTNLHDGGGEGRSGRRMRRVWVVAGGAAACAAAVAIGLSLAPSAEQPLSSPAATAPRAAVTTVTTTARATTTVTSGPSRVWPPPSGDADGAAGRVVEANGARFTVGDDDDVVVTGDWDCDGAMTLALLRPRTGEVFTFAGWADHEQEVAGQPAGVVPGAHLLEAADGDGDGCHQLVAHRPDGATAVGGAPGEDGGG